MPPPKLRLVQSDNVVPVIAARPVPAACPASMDTMDPMDSQANPEIADHQPDQLPNSFPNHPINARAKLHQETEAPQDPKEAMDHQEMQAHQALMVNQEIKDHADPLAHPAQLEDPETKEHQVNPANSQAKRPVHLAQPVPTANPVLQALAAKLVKLVKTAPLVPQVLQAMPALQAELARTAPQAVLANQAKLVHPALAITAHRLVWLQVIKHWRPSQLAINIHQINSHCDQKQIAKIMISLSSITHFFFFILTQTFHVKKIVYLNFR
jgi:hypothetical protein